MNINFLIEENDIETAKFQCKYISDSKYRSRSVAARISAIVAKKFFEETNKRVDIETELSTIEDIPSSFKISDIYVNDNYIDVRLYFDEKNLCVPRSHFENDTLPLAYMFVKVSDDIKEATITGFILPDTITRVQNNTDYYLINENALSPYEEIEYLLRDNDDPFNVEDIEIYNFLDNKLDRKQDFIRKLILSQEGRRRFKKAYNAKLIFANVNLDDIPVQNDTEQTELYIPEEISFTDTSDFSEVITNKDIKPIEQIADEQNVEQNYQFSTVLSPNLDETENIDKPEEVLTEEALDSKEDILSKLEKEIEESEIVQAVEDNSIESEEIQTLFSAEDTPTAETTTFSSYKKKKSPLLMIALLIVVLGGAGYFGYTQFFQQQNNLGVPPAEEVLSKQPEQQSPASEAMPVETVEKFQTNTSKEEGNSVSIPAIEKNLDASILVSNLHVEWDVPAGYVSNIQAQRYLTKLGKIIQLNLKTELLLLSRPPISNKIAIEIKYNSNIKGFEVVDFTTSSGEKSVDDVIMQTVKNALTSKINISTESFDKLSGNPVIIIKL